MKITNIIHKQILCKFFLDDVYNGYHDLSMIPMNLSNIAILNLKVLIMAVLLAELAKVRA